MNRFFDFLEDYWFWIILGLAFLISGYYDHRENMKDKEIRSMIVKDSLEHSHPE